jgi:hypothetical protein
MPRQYLKDASLNTQLEKEGYVVIRMLSDKSIETLTSKFSVSHDEDKIVPFYATAHHQDTDFREQMGDAILKELKPAVDETFIDCELLGGSFIVKTKSDQSLLQPHQDWNIVDENDHRSFNIWIPLVDLTEKNGAIEVLPKSHTWLRGYRHSSIPCAYQQVHNLVWENMKPLYLKAGEALVYDHSMLHASKANNTDQLRIAIASGVKPKEAEMFFYWNNNGTVEQYRSSPEFFMSQDIFAGPTGLEKVADLAYDFPKVDETMFCNFAGIEPPVKEVEPEPQPIEAQSESDSRSFWETYTPMNIIREINYRLRSR